MRLKTVTAGKCKMALNHHNTAQDCTPSNNYNCTFFPVILQPAYVLEGTVLSLFYGVFVVY